jgi:hypothetical protein
MSKIPSTYNTILKSVSGKKWKDDKTFRVGHAGAAIVVSFLDNRSLKLSDLVKNLPDFHQSEIRTALKNLKANEYFTKDKDGQYLLSVDEGVNLADGIFWGLLINVAQGFIQRKEA